jgi:putative spermidine/putrescine transport system permease protein
MVAVVIGLSYLWLPYMVLPIYAGMEKLPDSIIDASADLGAKPLRTFLKVILPITWPAIIAGSLFTFSLSLGDYITVQILGGTFQMLGNVVYQNFALNLPFAAAVALIPVIVMIVYLASVRKTGALDNL